MAIIRDNTVTGINVGQTSNALNCGFHIVSINGTEFCDNTVDQSFIGMHFSNSNDVDLRTTDFDNHTYGLRITGSNGKIGEQKGTGNQWDLDPDACVEKAAQNLSLQPLNSEIIVTQDDILPWLPDHDKLDPDPTIGAFWFYFSNDVNDAICKSPLEMPLPRELTPSEKEAVSNTSSLSGVYLWDLKRDVYTKLLVYPELRPTSSAEETFFNSLNGTLIDSLAQVTYQMLTGLSLSSGDQTDFDTYRAAIEEAFEDLAALDESLDYSDLDNLTGAWFLQRDTLLQLIASNAVDEVALESTRDIQVNADLEDALAFNTTIATALTYGTARKTINELHLSRLLALPMTEALYEKTLTLVQQAEEDTGAATEEGVRFLWPCDQGEYWDKEEFAVEEHGETHKSSTSFIFHAIPNPTSGLTDISLPKNNGGLLTVYNDQGQKIKTLSISQNVSNVFLDLSLFPNSYYWIVLSDEAGKVLGATKVSVSH